MPELRCNPFAARIVELFSEDGSGELDFQKVVNLFSVFSPRATAETKVVWAFAIWDFDGAPCRASMQHVQPLCHQQHLYLAAGTYHTVVVECSSWQLAT